MKAVTKTKELYIEILFDEKLMWWTDLYCRTINHDLTDLDSSTGGTQKVKELLLIFPSEPW
jgi:hypothetical protein